MGKILTVAGYPVKADQETIERKLRAHLKPLGSYTIMWAGRTPSGRPSVAAKNLEAGEAQMVVDAVRDVIGVICTYDIQEAGARLTS